MSTTLAVIGGGNMARAIIDGAVHGNILDGNQIAIADPDEQSRMYFDSLGCATFADASDLPEADCFLLAVKPQIFENVAPFIRGNVVYSIMAGVTIDSITKATGHDKIVRIMPNLPCSVGQGAAGIALSAHAVSEDAALARQLFSQIGVAVEVSEDLMDAVTAVSGSGPAYVFMLAEAMIDGGVRAGLDRSTATTLVKQTITGAAALMNQDKRLPEELREAVTSKGGTTSAALDAMNDRDVPESIASAVVAARDRGRELGAP
jgi:pyrroline-5-carboxylate reductase